MDKFFISKEEIKLVKDSIDWIRAEYTCDFNWEAVENSVYKIEKIMAEVESRS